MLSRTQLQQLANATSFSRGEDYFYNNAVRRIKRVGNTFTGKVEGSELYEVSLVLSELRSEFECDCPYDYDGICKHCVAFGLAVIDEFGPVVQLVDSITIPDQPLVSLAEVWQQTSTDQKVDFLRQLLEKQPELQVQFAQFVGTEQPALKLVFFTRTDNKQESSLDAISTEVVEALSDLRFDDEGLEMDEEDYYSEESPDPTPLIESVLTVYAERVAKALREGRLTDAITVYMGVYEGTLSATEPEADDYDTIDNYPEQTWEVWHELLAGPLRQLSERVIHPEQISRSLSQLAERVLFFDAQDAEDDEDDTVDDDDFYDEQAPKQIWYNLKSFEPLLLALVTDEPSARLVQQAINEYNWQNRGTEYVQLRIAEKLADSVIWLQIADSFADQDQTIANWLLERRRQMGDLSVLLQTLHRLTKQFPKAFDAFILNNLDDTLLAPGPDLTLYLTALENRCRSAGHLSDYLKLRGFWTPAQRRQFADSLSTSYMINALFYAQVLQTEGRTDDLFAWLKSLSWHYTQALPDILPIAAKTHPNECMDLAMERINGLLGTGKRDRGLYQMIAGWLAALYTVQSLKPQVTIFASHLQVAYNRLSALKDELRIKGLIRK